MHVCLYKKVVFLVDPGRGKNSKCRPKKYVDPKGPAAKVGLRGISRNRYGEYYIGDIIIGVDNKPIKTYDDLFSIIDRYKIGDTVKIKYIRDNLEKTTTIKLVQI